MSLSQSIIMSMKNIKQYKIFLIIGLVIIGFGFYWISIRPVQIKKNCAWTKEVIPADAGVTKEQAEINKKIYDNCILSSWKCAGGPHNRVGLARDTLERLPQPERTEIIEASDSEYKTCLRQHGL